jgi:hypothetical protein
MGQPRETNSDGAVDVVEHATGVRLMQVLLTMLATAASVILLGWMAFRDPRRLRAQDGNEVGVSVPFTTGQRRSLAFAASVPGLLLMLIGWWSSSVMWLGATITLLWVWLVWLARARAN